MNANHKLNKLGNRLKRLKRITSDSEAGLTAIRRHAMTDRISEIEEVLKRVKT